MKNVLIAFGLAAAALGTGTPAAQAQNYPWCEYIGGGFGGGGGRNCGFVSYQQCMESARGNGNDCRPNTMYEPRGGDAYQPVHRSRKHKHS